MQVPLENKDKYDLLAANDDDLGMVYLVFGKK